MSAVSPVIDSLQFRQYIKWLNSKSNEDDEFKPRYLPWQSLCMPQAIHFVCRHVEIPATDELPPFWKSAREIYACVLAWTWRFYVFSRVALGRECCRGRPYLLMDTKVIFALRWKKLSSKQKLTGCCSQSISLGRMKMIFTVALMSTMQLLTPRWDQTFPCIWFFVHIDDSAEKNIGFKAYVVFSLY